MKPPYKVPGMKEIAAVPWNGYTVVSTFSGAGGSCLGYRMAGYRVLWANEFVRAAQEVYKANHPDSILNTSDIRDLSAADIRDAIGDVEVDILDGSPPCAAFSTAGKGAKGWGQVKDYSDTKQRVDDLFFEYARILKDLQPRVFIAENVSGLVKGKAKGYFKLILQELKDCGYAVKVALLNAMWLGVPQSRERLIFVGIRQDVADKIGTGISFFPAPLPYYYTVGEAWETLDSNNNNERWHLTPRMKSWWEYTPAGKSIDIGVYKVEKRYSSFTERKLHFNQPSTTIKCSITLYMPDIPATPTIPQVKRLSSFPDDFVLSGTFKQQWERIARAVPPVMMRAIAVNIQEQILCRIT